MPANLASPGSSGERPPRGARHDDATYGPRCLVSNAKSSAHPRRLVVVPKPLTLLPTVVEPADPATQDAESRAIARRIELARAEHAHGIAVVAEALGGSPHEVSWVANPSAHDLAGADLVITIGGDGTFLTVARHVVETPLFGVNSSPSTSTGHYCAATAATFAERLDDVLADRVRSSVLTRIAVEVDADDAGPTPVALPALNDVLFAHRVPVASTRYALKLGDHSELQLSSGIWVATASGSTGAMGSAGGEIMRVDDPRLQFRVREPYTRGTTTPTLLSGFVDRLEIVSRNDKNALFLDGHAEPVAVPFGARAIIRRAATPLHAFLAWLWEDKV